MLAILKSLTLLVARIANSTLLVQCDNKTVVAFLRNEGGTRSPTLLKFTKQIYQILYSHKIYLRIHRIPGKYKSHADHLSRHRTPPEWHLVPQCTNKKKKKNLREVRCSGDKLVFLDVCKGGSKLCVTRPERPSSSVSRYFLPKLAFLPSEGISTPISDSEGHT
ncbi:unnamed protein product [Leptosia nina]|uniref:Uncharacterized protein n=1 Tax=Leptosia nina TaxID=320188 RepID=A0AAV1IUY5_9NEOP